MNDGNRWASQRTIELMGKRVDAVFENGVFRPESPVDIAEGQRVCLNVETSAAGTDSLDDVRDLLDVEFMESCKQRPGTVPSLSEVQKLTSAFKGSLADRISAERDER